MEDLFDAILRNPFLVLLIIGGIISFFKGKNEKQEDKKRPPETKPKRPEPRPVNQRKEVIIKQEPPRAQEQRVERLTIEEHQQKQMESLMSRLHTMEAPRSYERPNDANIKREIEVQNLVSQYNHTKFKKSFVKSLNKEGLINSIIMAEVLGLPRAKQPYQSVAVRRSQK